MQELLWMDDYHVSSIEECIEFANQLYWNITLAEAGGKWAVLSGEKAIFCADNREAVDAFLYGMGLAYSVIPPHIVDQLKKELDLE